MCSLHSASYQIPSRKITAALTPPVTMAESPRGSAEPSGGKARERVSPEATWRTPHLEDEEVASSRLTVSQWMVRLTEEAEVSGVME